ncbi:hypothetical protein GCM10022216_26310 [Sphingobacterium kyonggiense]|uniref:Carboxypeptidase-like protein n=1 Tax=Sphingobacterium kyonggiense TaxID=714075 RepID=A0ABP7YZ13_9SPHI
MKTLLLILFLGAISLPHIGQAQQRLDGIVYDVITKQRLGEVQIRNIGNNNSIYNDSRGEFSITASPGDQLIFRKAGYLSDTIIYKNQAALIVNLKEAVKQIQEVQVYGRRNPDDVLDEMKREYKKAFNLAAPKEAISIGPTGVGLSIDYLYSMVSKEAKNARRFTEFIGKVHEQNIIDYRFTPELVRNLIGLEGEDLQVFMKLFRPSYEFISTATEMQLRNYIKKQYEIFKLHPNLRPLRELPDIKLDVKKEK